METKQLSRRGLLSMGVMLAAAGLAGCVSTSAQMQSSQDGRFTLHDIRLQKGGVIHWAVLGVDNAAGGQVIVNFGGETLTLGRQLVENLMSPGVLAAVISGAAGIRIAEKGSCGGKGCGGNIFYVQAVSGSVSGAEAEAEASSGGGKNVHLSSKGTGEPPLIIKLTREQQVLHDEALVVFKHALATAY
jgi:hypothetical protein